MDIRTDKLKPDNEATFDIIRHTELGPTYVGVRVEVYSFGRWYPGEIVKLNRVRALVRYTTGSGATRERSFNEGRVRLPRGKS